MHRHVAISRKLVARASPGRAPHHSPTCTVSRPHHSRTQAAPDRPQADPAHRDGADEAELPDLADHRVRLPGADGNLLIAALRVVAAEEAAVRVHHALAEAPAAASRPSTASTLG